MHITRLVLRNFRGCEHLEVTPAPRLTLIVAMNGIGKTSIIDALAASMRCLVHAALAERPERPIEGLVSETDHRRVWLTKGAQGIEVKKVLELEASARWSKNVDWGIHSFRTPSSAAVEARPVWSAENQPFSDELEAVARSSRPLPLLAAIRARRTLRQAIEPSGVAPLATKVPERLLNWAAGPWLDAPWSVLRDRWRELEGLRNLPGERAKAAYGSLIAALKSALDFSLADAPYWSGDLQDVMILLPDEGWRPVGLMSDGWHAYVSTIVAVAMRCADINPAEPDAARVTPGVLLIDEIEQHLHPALQLTVVDALRAAFPKLQIIATTHSPLVLTDIKPDKPDPLALTHTGSDELDCVLRLDRDADDQTRITRLEAPVGRNAVQVLTGAWFGLASTLDDDTLELLARHRDLLRQGTTASAERKALEAVLRGRLQRYAETSEEELVLSVVAELENNPEFAKLDHEKLLELREKVLDAIKRGLQ